MDAETQAKLGMEGDLGACLGSQFMAVTFEALMCGVIMCQALRWLPMFRNEKLIIKIAVPFASIAAIITTCFTWTIYMRAFVHNFGQFAPFADLKYFGIYPVLDVLTVIPVQLIFADRSFKINQRNIFIGIIDYGMIALTAGTAITTTALSRHSTVYTKSDALMIVMVLWPAVCTCTHLILTGSILYGLYRTREGANHTRHMVDRVIFMSLESQTPATLFAFTAMVVIASNVNSPFIPWIVIIHPKVFLIGCLAMVNVRHTWQREGKLPSSLGSTAKAYVYPRSQQSGDSAPSDAIATPKIGGSPSRPGPIMLSTFDEEDGPGVQLSDLGKETKDRDNMEISLVSPYKLGHMD